MAGNIKNSDDVVVDTIPIPKGTGAFEMKANPTNWTKDSVTVTITKKVEGYEVEYSKDGGEWETGTSVELDKNGTVHARLTDGVNKGEIQSLTIDNIDKDSPRESQIEEQKVTSNSLVAQVTVQDDLSGIAKVEWQYKENSEDAYKTKTEQFEIMNGNKRGSNVQKVSNLNLEGLSTGTYNIKATIYDVAGNQTEVTKDITIKTIPSLTKDVNVTFTQTPMNWTKGNVQVGINSTESEYDIEKVKEVVLR